MMSLTGDIGLDAHSGGTNNDRQIDRIAVTLAKESDMKSMSVLGALWAMFLVPCFAGDLEAGVKFHQRTEYAKAIGAFQKAISNGNAEAARRLGFMYYHGEGVRQDNKKAVNLFEKAAEAGDRESAANLAKMYEFGMAVELDLALAVKWYLKAAEMGDRFSQFSASVMYYKGEGVPRDRVEAAKWWTIAQMDGGRWAENVRVMVESAEAKLTTDEMAEAKRRAKVWHLEHGAQK